MAGRAVAGPQLGQFRRDLRAGVDGQRAPPAEPAAGGRVDDPGRLAAVGLGRHRQRRARVGHRGQQQLGVRVPGVGEHVLDRPGLGDLAGVHHDQPVGHVPRAGDVVGDVEDGHALLVAQLGHQVEQADPDRHVEHRDRLVGQDQPRLHGQRLGEADPLPLAAAQLVGEPLQHVGVQPDHLEDPGRFLAPLRLGQRRAVQLQAAQHAVLDPEHRVDRGERVLEHHRHQAAVAQPLGARGHRGQRLALEEDLARGRLVDPGQHPGDGGLAAAALPGQGHDLPLADGEADIVHGVQRPPGQRAADLEVPAQVLGLSAAVTGHDARLPSSRRRQRTSVSVQRVQVGRDLGALVDRVRAARVEPAAGRHAGQVGRVAGDPLERDARAADGREGLEQALRCRGAAAGRRSPGWRRARPPGRRTSPSAGRRSG